MNLQEKILYHQIHPLKLSTDITTGILSLIFLWFHSLWIALIIGIVPSILITLLIISFINLQKYKESNYGLYVKKYMTREVMILRGIGYVIAAFGAWFNSYGIVIFGFIILLFGWCSGKILPHGLGLRKKE